MADFPKSNSEVPFLSELQFCSKVEVNNSSESEASPALPKKVVLIHRPDLAAILDSQDQSDISPGRFASSRSRDLLDSSSHGSSGQIGPVGSRPIQIRPLKTRRNPISRAFLGCAQPFKACLRPVREELTPEQTSACSSWYEEPLSFNERLKTATPSPSRVSTRTSPSPSRLKTATPSPSRVIIIDKPSEPEVSQVAKESELSSLVANIEPEPRVKTPSPSRVKTVTPSPSRVIIEKSIEPEEPPQVISEIIQPSKKPVEEIDNLINMSKSPTDDFAAFAGRSNAGAGTNGHTNGDHYDYDDEDDVEIDFEPQNGYVADTNMADPYPEVVETAGKKQKWTVIKNPERGRDEFKMPNVDIRGKLASMNVKVKSARMPSPHELRESYLNSGFHKSFKQPLAVRTRVEDVDTQKARQLLTEKMTPIQLGNLKHPLDIPLPKINLKPSAKTEDDESVVEFDPKVLEGGKLYNTLPRSWRTQNLVTSAREMTDLDELSKRKQLIESKSPAELGNINSLSEFPVPTKIKKIISPSERVIAAQKRTRSADKEEKENEPFTLYGTLPRSMRETKLLTNTREILDEDEVNRRKELILARSPTQLSEIHGLEDFPVPTRLQNLFQRPASMASKNGDDEVEFAPPPPKNFSETMYATLPKSWKEQNLITKVKTDQDPDVIALRKELTQTKTPAELAQISSVADLPIPTALENFLKSGKENGVKRGEDDEAPPSKPITKMNLEDMYNTLPRSLKTELLTSSRVMEDPEELALRKELIATKTPKELSAITSLDEFPLPTKIETLVRKKKRTLKSTSSKESIGKRSKSWSELTDINTWKESMPESLKAQVLVKAQFEDPEIQMKNQEITKTKTVQELSQINSLAEFPIPKTIETLLEKKITLEKSSEDENLPLKDKLYATLPRSMKSEVLVRAREEEPDVQKMRQELTRAKSPTELSQINSLADFPIPKQIEDLMAKKTGDAISTGPTPPPRRFKKADMYATLPASLKTELLVKSEVNEGDEEILKQRQELILSKSPSDLSEIRALSDFPIPEFVENLSSKIKTDGGSTINSDGSTGITMEKIYDNLPSSLKSEVLVRSRQEEPEVQQARAEVIKTKSVNELSKINSLNEFPLPKKVEQMIGRDPRPVERRKKFRQLQRSQSSASVKQRVTEALPNSLKTPVLVKSRIEDPDVLDSRRKIVESKSVSELSQMTSISDFPIPTTIERLVSVSRSRSRGSEIGAPPSFDVQNLYGTLPSSLKTELMTRSRYEDPEIQQQRRQVTQSKSVSELSKIEGLADFPIPTTIEKMIHNKKDATNNAENPEKPEMSWNASNFQENIYATLPKSLKSEVLVRTRVESPEVQESRKSVVQSKSVSELSQVKNFADFPLPTPIEHLIQGKTALHLPKPEQSSEGGYDIYASLPRSLKSQVLVRSKVEEDENVLKERQNIVSSKTPAELSQIHSFNEIPLPRRVEAWLHHDGDAKLGSPRSFHELSMAGAYETLPKSLKEPTLVRSKIEEPDLQRERFEITRSKTPSQLAEIHSLSDIPIPGLWERGRTSHRTSMNGSGRSSSIPKNKQELKDIVYNKILPESLIRPVMVRSKRENPDTLQYRQSVQQTKSIHELSKIRNLKDFPMHPKVQGYLPDLPLPSVKGMIGVIARVPTKRSRNTSKTDENGHHDADLGFTPASTPHIPHDSAYTDDEMLRFEMSSPESMAHRDQDFDYEVIEAGGGTDQFGFMQTQVPVADTPMSENFEDAEENSISVADHYRGTPPLRSKKKGGRNSSRFSQEIPSEFQAKSPRDDILPPPIPQKKRDASPVFRVNPSTFLPESEFTSNLPDLQDMQARSQRDDLLPPPIPQKKRDASPVFSETQGRYVNPYTFLPDSVSDLQEMQATDVNLDESEHYPPGPKIAYSYQNNPHRDPPNMRKISTNSQTYSAAATADMTPTPPPASVTPSAGAAPPSAPSRPDRRGSSAGKTVSRSNTPGAAAANKRPPSATSVDNQSSMLDQWHSVRSEMNTRNTDDDTLYTAADTSMADTLVGSDELHSVADTLNDHSDDDEYFGEMLPRDRNSRHLEDD